MIAKNKLCFDQKQIFIALLLLAARQNKKMYSANLIKSQSIKQKNFQTETISLPLRTPIVLFYLYVLRSFCLSLISPLSVDVFVCIQNVDSVYHFFDAIIVCCIHLTVLAFDFLYLVINRMKSTEMSTMTKQCISLNKDFLS